MLVFLHQPNIYKKDVPLYACIGEVMKTWYRILSDAI